MLKNGREKDERMPRYALLLRPLALDRILGQFGRADAQPRSFVIARHDLAGNAGCNRGRGRDQPAQHPT